MTGTARAEVLRVEQLVVEYPTATGAHRAVDDVSFTIERGSTLAVVGESGKSTVARSLVRLITPTTGKIVLDGVDIAAMPERGPTERVLASLAEPYTPALRVAALDPSTIHGRQPRGVLAVAERAA